MLRVSFPSCERMSWEISSNVQSIELEMFTIWRISFFALSHITCAVHSDREVYKKESCGKVALTFKFRVGCDHSIFLIEVCSFGLEPSCCWLCSS